MEHARVYMAQRKAELSKYETANHPTISIFQFSEIVFIYAHFLQFTFGDKHDEESE